jgi:hypothetical protein
MVANASYVKKANTTQYYQQLAQSHHREQIGTATHGKPLSIICLVGSKQRTERIVSGDNEAGDVGQELAAEVEDDQEEVQGAEAKHSIGLGNRRLPLKVVESGVLGELRHRSVR